jgi:hypothetical protein
VKAPGVKLGTPENLTREAQLKGARAAAVARVEKATADQADVAEIAAEPWAEELLLRSYTIPG